MNTRNLSGLRDESVNDRAQVSAKLIHQLSDATRVSTRLEYLDEYKVERADLTKEALEKDPTQAGRLSSSTDLAPSSLCFNLEHLLESGQFDFALVHREKDTMGESRFTGPQDENDLGYSSKLMYRHDVNQSNLIMGYNGYHGEQHTDQYERGDPGLSGSFRHPIYNLNINAYSAPYRLNPSDDMILTDGLRYEKAHLASINFTSNNDAQCADFSELAPKLGLTYQLNSDYMLWLGVSKGFYTPGLDDLYAPDEGDPNLEPEEASNVELGFRGHFGDWQYDTSIYHNNITHYLVIQEFENNDGTEYELTTNAAKVSAKGFESVIEYTH